MKFLNVIAVMAIAFSLPAMTARPFSSPKSKPTSTVKPNSIVKPRATSTVKSTPTPKGPTILPSVPGEFSLQVLVPNERGKISLTDSRPVKIESDDVLSGAESDFPRVDGDGKPAIFSLTDKKLFKEGFEATLLDKYYTFPSNGLRNIVWYGFRNDDIARFTAVKAVDSYGKNFLRLGADDGEFLMQNHLLLFPLFLSLPPFFFFLSLSLSLFLTHSQIIK